MSTADMIENVYHAKLAKYENPDDGLKDILLDEAMCEVGFSRKTLHSEYEDDADGDTVYP